MADTLVPQTPPKKLFKPASKTKTPTRVRPSPQSATQQQQQQQPQQSQQQQSSQSGSSQNTLRAKDAPRSTPSLDSVAKSTNLAPLTHGPAASDKASDHGGSDTTGETPVGLVDNYILTPTETASRSTDAQSPPLSRNASQNVNRASSWKDKIARAKETAKDSANGLANTLTGRSSEAPEESTTSSSPTESKSPIDIAKYFRDQGHPEMSNFVASLIGNQSSESSEDTPRASKSPAGEKQSANNQSDNKNSDQDTSKGSDEASRVSDKLEKAAKDLKDQGHPEMSTFVESLMEQQSPDSSDVSKTADGTFRDTVHNAPNTQPTNKMGEPDVASISQEAHPAVPSSKSDAKSSSEQRPQVNGNGQDKDDANTFDNMGRPAQVNRSIEIPLQRPQKKENGTQQLDGQSPNTASKDLGDFEDIPGTDDVPGKSEDDSPDPPEEILDPSVHSSGAANITPIPKIPKIPHIDALPPFNLQRLAQGLAGHEVDDIGNIVDENGEVLGHATGDLPAMVGKKVSDNGEVHGDDDEIVGYVSDNFINPPSPTEIPGDVIGGLRVDHKGNILDTEGNIIGKFNQPLGKSGSSTPKAKGDADAKPKEQQQQKPKINAQTGGSPSDLFLDVKSTNDGIQLTIRIPTTFSRPSSEQ